MNIGWLNDYKLDELQGGATITGKFMIDKGRELDHDITEFTPTDLNDESVIEESLNSFDFLILNNINNFKKEVIEWIIHNIPYVKYEHDYCFCQYRSAQCELCAIKCEPAKIFKDLFANSKLNIFFSPLQLNIFKRFFGQTMRDAIIIPAPFDKTKWYPDKSLQQDAYLFAGVLSPHKGITQILDYADSLQGTGAVFHFAGKAVNKDILDRIKDKYTYLGEISHDDMPKLLRKYKHFVINPMMPETFGLVILEAMLSGCGIIKFEKSHTTGLESYNKSPTELIELCHTATDTFWEEVSKVV